jgi:hypothetical protein
VIASSHSTRLVTKISQENERETTTEAKKRMKITNILIGNTNMKVAIQTTEVTTGHIRGVADTFKREIADTNQENPDLQMGQARREINLLLVSLSLKVIYYLNQKTKARKVTNLITNLKDSEEKREKEMSSELVLEHSETIQRLQNCLSNRSIFQNPLISLK